jgi:AP-1 complex subunit sigma 1/2
MNIFKLIISLKIIILNMIHLMLLVNRQGKIRLMKWYDSYLVSERQKYIKELSIMVIGRSQRLSNVIEWNNYKVIYKRFASLYFITLCDKEENELIILELLQHFVECLDRYFGNVCELDIIFNFHKAYYIIEEILSGGNIQESDRKEIQKILTEQDTKLNEEKEEDYQNN